MGDWSDADAFVASYGDHRGAFLEIALDVLNARSMEQSDIALATWALTEFPASPIEP